VADRAGLCERGASAAAAGARAHARLPGASTMFCAAGGGVFWGGGVVGCGGFVGGGGGGLQDGLREGRPSEQGGLGESTCMERAD